MVDASQICVYLEVPPQVLCLPEFFRMLVIASYVIFKTNLARYIPAVHGHYSIARCIKDCLRKVFYARALKALTYSSYLYEA